MIRLVVFDFSGVIADRSLGDAYFEKEFAKFLRRNGAGNRDANRAWKGIPERIHRGRMTMADGRKIFLRRLGLPLTLLSEYRKIDNESWRRVKLSEKSVAGTLSKLREDGVRLAVLSDTLYGSRNLRKMSRMLGIGDRIDALYVSAEMGLKKPHRRTYATVLAAFKVRPEETLYVAHDDDELVGARRLGIRTVSYRGDKNADYRISRFSDIAEIVRALNDRGSTERLR